MKSYWMEGREGQLHIEMREVDMPQVGAGQLLVKIHAAGLNRGEFIVGPGPHGGLPHAKPIGMEAAGEVVAIGAGVDGFAVGQRVMGRCPGGFSQFGLMSPLETMPMPDTFDWAQAAATPVTFMVAHDMLVAQGQLKDRERDRLAAAGTPARRSGRARPRLARPLASPTRQRQRAAPRSAGLPGGLRGLARLRRRRSAGEARTSA